MCCFFKKRKKIVKALFQSFPLVLLFSSTLTFFSLLAVLIYGSPSQNGKTANFTPQKKKRSDLSFFHRWPQKHPHKHNKTQHPYVEIPWGELFTLIFFFYCTVSSNSRWNTCSLHGCPTTHKFNYISYSRSVIVLNYKNVCLEVIRFITLFS